MKLSRFKVTTFRSVSDSGWIAVDGVSALIGVNESGKTNLLLPLWKLNPAREGEIRPTSDYPKSLFGTIRENPGDFVFITAEFATGVLAEKLAALTDLSLEKVQRVHVSRYFDGEYSVDFPDAEPSRVKAGVEIEGAIKAALEDIDRQSGLQAERTSKEVMLGALRSALETDLAGDLSAEALRQIHRTIQTGTPSEPPKTSVISPRYAQLMDQISSFIRDVESDNPGSDEAIQELVLEALPKFVYYSNYGNLDSEIYLPHVVQNLKRQDLGSKEAAKARTLRVLFKFVRLSAEEILELGRDLSPAEGTPTDSQIEETAEKKRERSILLQSASTLLTQRFREWWKQGDYRFRFEADGDHFRIWVADERRPEEIELESRSTGLQWFLSFYLVFLVESEEAHKGAVLLLDEPGLSLHPLAQRDLSAFFDGLADTNQIIYTTHSPFLVDADRLDRARKVYVDADGTTKATDNLREGVAGSTQGGAAYAVHSALNLTIAESLLLGCQPVVVEGPADQHYLTVIKTLLIGAGKITPQRELVFPPSGGAKTARLTASILTGRDDELPRVLLDDDVMGKKMAQEMRTSLYVTSPQRVLSVADFTGVAGSEIEDLFSSDIIADAVDRLFRAPEPEDEFATAVVSDQPIVPQIEKWAERCGVVLPLGWKVLLAKRIKQQLLSRGISAVAPTQIEVWTRLFAVLSDPS